MDFMQPIAYVAEVMHLTQEPVGLPGFWQWIYILNIFKVWRFLLPAPDRSLERSTFVFSVLELFVALMVFTHVFACLFGVLAMVERDFGENSWADDLLNDATPSCYDFYIK